MSIDAASTVLIAGGLGVAIVGLFVRLVRREQVDATAVAERVRADVAAERAGGPAVHYVVRENSVVGIAATLICAGLVVSGVTGNFSAPWWQAVLAIAACVLVTTLLVAIGGWRFAPMLRLDSEGISSLDRPHWTLPRSAVGEVRMQRTRGSSKTNITRVRCSNQREFTYNISCWTAPGWIVAVANTLRAEQFGASSEATEG